MKKLLSPGEQGCKPGIFDARFHEFGIPRGWLAFNICGIYEVFDFSMLSLFSVWHFLDPRFGPLVS